MDNLSRDELRALSERAESPSVSIYLATHRVGDQTQQDPIRLKTLLRNAEDQLIASGLRTPEAHELLDPAKALLLDSGFWRDAGDGLALFRSPNLFRTYRLPITFADLVYVGPRFAIKPLLPLVNNDGRFFILAFTEEQVRLLEATRHTWREVKTHAAPQGQGEAVLHEVAQKQRRFHTLTTPFHPLPSAESGRGHPVYHGQGIGTNDGKRLLMDYFHAIDRGLQEVLHGETAPLVLAGVEYYFPMYREANTYPHLLDEGVLGSPEYVNDQDLHNRAWNVVEHHFDQARQEAVAEYRDLAATPRGANRVEEILPAANQGRVQFLFVPTNAWRWGTFDPANARVEIHEQRQPGDEDLLDRAAAETILHRGEVFAVRADEMPDREALAAAVYRY